MELKDIELERLKEKKKETLEFVKNSTNPKIDKMYAILTDYVNIISEGMLSSLVLIGEAGLGKTLNTLRTLSKNKTDFTYVCGNCTPLELYHILYKNKDKVIVLDDVLNIIRNKQSVALLFSAMWSGSGNSNDRIVEWRSTTGALDAPKQFNFNGRIIILLNEVQTNNTDIKTLLSRCLHYNLKFTYKETIRLMREIAKLPHKKLNLRKRNNIVDFIEKNTNPTTKDFNLRLQKKFEQIYIYNYRKWKRLSLNLITNDKTKEIVLDLLNSDLPTEERIKKFTELTTKRRSTYYSIVKQLK